MDYTSGVVVLDSGSSCIKVGYAGEDLPRSVFPSVVGHPVVGSEGFRKPAPPFSIDGESGFNESQPIIRGVVEDWDKLEKVWEYSLSIGLDNDKEGSGGCPAMLTEAPLSDPTFRSKAAQYLFESASCPAVCSANSAVLSLFASGRTRGIVLEVGGGITCAVPVFEGFALDHATQRVNLGGQDVTRAMAKTLAGAGFGDDAVQCAQQIKEKCGFVSPTSSSNQNGGGLLSISNDGGDKRGSTFELPDGTVIQIHNTIRSSGPNSVLFPSISSKSFQDQLNQDNENNEKVNNDSSLPSSSSSSSSMKDTKSSSLSMINTPRAANPKEGVGALVLASINKCDEELIPDLWGNVVVAGGGSMFPNFTSRVSNEIIRLRQDNYPYGAGANNMVRFDGVGGGGGDGGGGASSNKGNHHHSSSSNTHHQSMAASVVPNPLKPENGYNSQRGAAAWVGGSMFASLETYSHVAVTKAEWEEHGAVIMQRKCF